MSPSHLRLVRPPERSQAGPPRPATEPPPLAIERLEAGYGRHKVLHRLDLTVPGGCITALTGPKGAGKSTLLHAICGRLPAKAGEVRVCGIPAGDAEARRKIGLVPAGIALYPALTITENLSLFAELSGLPVKEARERVSYVLARTGTRARQDQRVDRLSVSWQRRANVAAALVGAPRLLLLDEPTTGMDAPAREDLAGLLRTLAGEGLGVLLATHDLDFAEQVAARAAILKGGRMVLEGALADLIAQHFAHQQQMEISFTIPLSPLRVGLISSLGLAVEGMSARGLISDSPRVTSELLARLDAAGLAPRSVTLRPPGLAALSAATTSRPI